MGEGWLLLVAAVAGLAGALSGWIGRRVLAALPRGALVRPGPMEAAGALLAAVGVLCTVPGPRVGLVAVLGLLTVWLGAVDLACRRLPDLLTVPAVALALVTVGLTWLLDPGSGHPVRAVAVAVVVWGGFAVTAVASPRSMGWGDVKLVPSLAGLTGYLSVATAAWWLVLAFVGGALVALAGVAAGRMGRRSTLPFGPFLLLGAWGAAIFTPGGLIGA